jgi:HEAT repeat protein
MPTPRPTFAVPPRRRRPALVLSTILLSTLVGCGGGRVAAGGEVGRALDAGEVGRATALWVDAGADDLPALRAIAAALLDAEARGDEPARRRSAVAQLASGGEAGRAILRRLGNDRDLSPEVRAPALGALARRGDREARGALRGMLDSDDQRVLAQAALSLDPGNGDDRLRLLALLEHPSPGARRVAALRLARAAPDTEVRLELARRARVDPNPGVRGTAVRSLVRWGTAVLPVLRERLSDAADGVRMAAVGALFRLDPEAATPILGRMFEAPPSRAGIEAARLFLQGQGGGRAGDDPTAPDPMDDPRATLALDARTYLRGALFAGETSLRAQAGIALSSARGWPELEAAVADRLPVEPDPGVRLALALALVRGEVAREEGLEALLDLLDVTPPGMPTLQAAALLLERDHPAVSERGPALLVGFLERGSRLERQAAARALAREAGAPEKAAPGLRDDDPLVRIHAAGAILAS